MDNEPNDAPPILIPFLIRGHNHEDADRFMDSISPNTRFRRLYFAAYFVADFYYTLGRENFPSTADMYFMYSTWIIGNNEVPLSMLAFRTLLHPISEIPVSFLSYATFFINDNENVDNFDSPTLNSLLPPLPPVPILLPQRIFIQFDDPNEF